MAALGDTGPDLRGPEPDSVAPPPRHVRFPLVDGMRALAVLCVVLVHCAYFGGALSGSVIGRLLAHLNIGVTIFFLISGFLLYRPFIAHRGGGAPPPAFGAYLRRRVLRIVPAYWLVLTVLLVLPGLPSVRYGHVWPLYALLQTVPLYGASQVCSLHAGCGLAQTWSLFAEVTFYAALPLYVVLTEYATRRLTVRVWLLTQALILAGLSTGSVLIAVVGTPAPWIGWSVAGNVFWFSLGMGLAIVSALTWPAGAGAALNRWMARWGALLWAAAAALYLALCAWLPPSPFLFATGQRLLAHLGFGLIALLLLAPVVLAHRGAGLPHRVLATRPVAWLGLVSYGIFLWHYAIVLTLGPTRGTGSFLLLTAGTLAISPLIAAASYYGLEAPVLRFK